METAPIPPAGAVPVQSAVYGGNTHHLLRSHADRLDAKLAVAHVKQVLQVGPEQVDNQDIVKTLLAEVVDLRNTRYVSRESQQDDRGATLYVGFKETRTSAVQRPVRSVLVAQLGGFRLARFLVRPTESTFALHAVALLECVTYKFNGNGLVVEHVRACGYPQSAVQFLAHLEQTHPQRRHQRSPRQSSFRPGSDCPRRH